MAIANIGDGATIYVGSDCYAATVIKVTARTIVLQSDNAAPADDYEYYGNQSYNFSPNINGLTDTFTLRKDGRLYMKGTEMGRGGIRCTIGSRRKYTDPSV